MIPADVLEATIARANAGCADDARVLIAYSVHYLKHGFAMPDALREYLGAALDEITQGIPADAALNLKRPRGRQEGAPYRPFEVVMFVHRFSGTRDDAITAAIKELKLPIGKRRIEQLLEEYRPWVEAVEAVNADTNS